METIKLIQDHRSIRKYLDKDIDDEILKELFTAGQWAPSSHNVQAYSIIVVRNKEVKDAISKFCGDQRWIRECPVFLVFCADFHRLKIATEMHGENHELDEIENLLIGTVDTALVAENIYIGAKSFGLGGVIIGGIRNNPKEVVRLLDLPKHVIPIVGMCLGYPDQNPQQKPRLPQNIVVHNEKYDTDIIRQGLDQYDEITSKYYYERTNGQRDKGWTELMSEYISTKRRVDLKDFIIEQGIKIL